MSSIGTGYDFSCTTFSPDGHVFQVDYAMKAVDNSGTVIGARCKDGVVLAAEKLIVSKMLIPGSNKRSHTPDKHLGMMLAGLQADARQIANRAEEEATNYRETYGDQIPGKVLAERLGLFYQAYTLYGSVRPFGCTGMLASYHPRHGHLLHVIDPSGAAYAYYGCAIGKGRAAAKTELEKLKLNELTCRQLIVELARIIHIVHDEAKDKAFELEMSWLSEETKWQHRAVPKDVKDQAEAAAKASLEEDMGDDEDEA